MNKYSPECPFCSKYIDSPGTTRTAFGEILSGSCGCGAVYVCDPTGRNTGEAYMEALALAKGDWEIGSMTQDLDYEVKEIEYDLKKHARVYSKALSDAVGRLVFIKLGKPVSDSESGLPDPNQLPGKGPRPGGTRKLKEKINGLLKVKALAEIADEAMKDKGVIKCLISLAYEKEDVVSWRAMEALGLVARKFSPEKIEVIRDTIRRLLWSMGEESGGIGWSSAEMLGEIIMNNPDAFSDIIPIVWSFREEEMFRSGVVWAMGRIASVRPDLVGFVLSDLGLMLKDDKSAVRGYAAWLMGMLAEKDEREVLRELIDDNSRICFYRKGELTETTVGEVVSNVFR